MDEAKLGGCLAGGGGGWVGTGGGGGVGYLRYPCSASAADRARGDLSRSAGSSLRCHSSGGRRRLMMSLMRGSLQGRHYGPRHANSSLCHLTRAGNQSQGKRNSHYDCSVSLSFSPSRTLRPRATQSIDDTLRRRIQPRPRPTFLLSETQLRCEQRFVMLIYPAAHLMKFFPTFPFCAGG